MRAAIRAEALAGIEKHLAGGGKVPVIGENVSFTHRGDTIEVENTLFGPADLEYMNLTPYGWNNNAVAGGG